MISRIQDICYRDGNAALKMSSISTISIVPKQSLLYNRVDQFRFTSSLVAVMMLSMRNVLEFSRPRPTWRSDGF